MTRPEDIFPSPRARRVAANAISVTAVLPFNAVITDAEADALIQQLQVARSMPAPIVDDAEIQRLDGEIETQQLRKGEVLKKIRNVSEQAFRDGLAERGITIEEGEALIRNFERSEVRQ